MPITDLGSTDLWKLLEKELDAKEEHICALPMRTYIKPVRVITVLRTDMEVSATNEECPKGSKDIKVSPGPVTPPPPVVEKPAPHSFFETSAEGWTLVGDSISPIPYYRPPSAGVPAIRGQDDGLAKLWYFNAPAKFLGDQSQAFGKLLTFRVWTNKTSASFEGDDVWLAGGGITIMRGMPPVTPKAWTQASFRLNGAGGWKVQGSGAAATDEIVKKVLANMTSLRIRGEFSAEQEDTGWLTQVILGKDG